MTHVFTELSDLELRVKLSSLAAADRHVEVELLLHLADLAHRRTFLEWGYNSMWDFARRELKWSERTSARRVTVAKLYCKCPGIAPYLLDGRVTVCVVAVLAPYLNAGNLSEVLAKAGGLSRCDAEALAVTLGAKPAVKRKDLIRLLGEVQSAPAPIAPPPTVAEPELLPQPVAPASPLPVVGSAPAEPAAPVRPVRIHRVAFDANDEFVANVKRLKEIFGNADLNEVMLRASEALLDRVDPIRRHIRRQSRKARKDKEALKQTITNVRSELRILKHRQPRAIQDEAMARDGAQCAYVSKDGVRCSARTWLHVDHIRPFAMGGSSTDIDNNRALCSAHNLRRSEASLPANQL